MFKPATTLAFITFLITATGCSNIPSVCEGCSNPWKSSGKNSTFIAPSDPGYDAYREYKLEILQSEKHFPEWVTAKQRAEQIEAISPKRHEPDAGNCDLNNRQGIILIHGLFDTPFIMRDLADHFKSRCFFVYDVLLTGHGTRPGDLNTISRAQWKSEVGHVVKAASAEVPTLYIGGYSLGGALSLHAAANYKEIKAAFVFAPALAPTSKLAYGSLGMSTFEGEFFKVFNEYDYAKYESLSHMAGSETYKLGHNVQRYLKDGFTKPLFVAVSLEDKTIDARHTVKTIRAKDLNKMLIFAADNSKADTLCDRYNLNNKSDTCSTISSAIETEGIKSLSHIGLVVDSNNCHYGKDGDYKNCLYAGANQRLCLESTINEDSCKKNIICYGEQIRSTVNPDDNPFKEPVIRRITFNPHFNKLTAEIDQFLKKLER
ncbi:MAG: alpha/beta fold hydrolase [Gammaproteobacteria bacterium]|nr:alpha/beta fold hydrolase [Gammaproteobacteria bacterium]